MKTSGIIMGVGAPNETRSGQKTMCAIILTRDYGFLRIYPIPAEDRFPVWSTVSVHLEKGNDGREESWRLCDWSIDGRVEDAAEKREILQSCELKSGIHDPIDYMNEARRSIALVPISWGSTEATLSQKIPSFVSGDDEECGWIVTQAKHWLKPYVAWTSKQGKEHTSHLGGREVYEGLRRNPTEPWSMMNNLQIMNPDYEKWLLLGNMKDRRNVWLCVHLHRLKKQTGGSTPLFSNQIIGSAEDWPYSKQEETNVPIVDGHPELFTMSDTTLLPILGNTQIPT